MKSRFGRYVAAMKGHERPVKFLIGWLLAVTVGPRLLCFQRGTYKLALQPTNLSVQFWCYPNRRREEEAFIASLLRPGDHVIDVGANIGSVACLAATAVGPKGAVAAIEAHPKTAVFLRNNIRLNGLENVTVIEMAASERSETLHFDSRSADDRNAVTKDNNAITVSAGRLDASPLSGERYRLLKIDIEGYELPALRGAAGILDRVEAIWFECDEALMAPFGYTHGDLLAFLRSQGYRIYCREDDGFRAIENLSDDAPRDLLAARPTFDFPVPSD